MPRGLQLATHPLLLRSVPRREMGRRKQVSECHEIKGKRSEPRRETVPTNQETSHRSL